MAAWHGSYCMRRPARAPETPLSRLRLYHPVSYPAGPSSNEDVRRTVQLDTRRGVHLLTLRDRLLSVGGCAHACASSRVSSRRDSDLSISIITRQYANRNTCTGYSAAQLYGRLQLCVCCVHISIGHTDYSTYSYLAYSYTHTPQSSTALSH